MKRAIKALLVLAILAALAVGLSMAVRAHPGYVLFAYKGFHYESSLWAFLALLATLVLLLWAVKLALRLSWLSIGVLNPWSGLNRKRRVRQSSEQGLLDFIEGRWARALRHLKRAAEGSEQPLMYYLSAARAAQHLGQEEESDRLLEQALERQPKAELAIALAHAELQQLRGNQQGALETLQVMHERHPHHHQVLKQLAELLEQRGDWSALLGLLPALEKAALLPAAEFQALQRKAWQGRLAQLGQASGDTALAELRKTWQQLSQSLRQEPLLLRDYSAQLARLGAADEALKLLGEALKRGYQVELLDSFGTLAGSDPLRQLQQAESWLKSHPNDPALLLCLGRISLHNKLWGKAREYLEASLKLAKEPHTCAELAKLLAQQGDLARSNQLLLESLAG